MTVGYQEELKNGGFSLKFKPKTPKYWMGGEAGGMAQLLTAPEAVTNRTDKPETAREMRSFEWLSRLAVSEVGQRVIEVGCGLGAWTRLLLNREQVVALDTHPAMVAGVLSRFSDKKNLEAFTLDVANAKFRELARFQPDSVLCVNALAAVRDDERALFNITTVLPRGGKVVLILPACPSLYGQIDMINGLRRRYSKESLRAVAERVGLRVQDLRYVNVAGFFGRWCDGLLEKMDGPSPNALRERMVPVLERLERWVNPPFGENLFAVLELPAQ